MLRPIPAQHIGEHWYWVRKGLLTCIDKTGEHWLPEDVYLSLKGGQSFLYAIEAKGEDIGFTILRQQFDPDGPVLYIWAMWCEPGAARAVEDMIYTALEAKAREIGAKRLRMQSPRDAWQREQYWRQTAVIYEHEVTL